jgi:hypothetical protein
MKAGAFYGATAWEWYVGRLWGTINYPTYWRSHRDSPHWRWWELRIFNFGWDQTPKSPWRTDWLNAPRGKDQLFLYRYMEGDHGIVTTVMFVWETASAYIDGYDGAWWELHDMVKDEPIMKEDGIEDWDGEWMEIPE